MAVLFSSGSPKEATNLDLDDLDHVAFIQKPYTGTQIVSKVRPLIAASTG